MAKNTFESEVIDGVTVEYVSELKERQFPAGCGIINMGTTCNGVKVDKEKLLRGYGKEGAAIAVTRGFKRVQIASYGDLSYHGLTKGEIVPLSTMYVARLLKR